MITIQSFKKLCLKCNHLAFYNDDSENASEFFYCGCLTKQTNLNSRLIASRTDDEVKYINKHFTPSIECPYQLEHCLINETK